MIVTVTMNAALDRTLTVPNFQRGQRHRASEKLTLAGGKGITVARALKKLGVPVVATGLAGGRNGRAHPRGARRGGDPLRLRAHRGRVADVYGSRRPDLGTFTEIMEWGPLVQESELEMLLEKLDYLARGAELVVFAGPLPRESQTTSTPRRSTRLRASGVLTVLDAEGEPLRQVSRPSRCSSRRTSAEAEAVVGQEFSEDGDFLDALERLEDMGARNALITFEQGCFASVRVERGQPKRFRAETPTIEAVSGVGSGAVLLAGFIAAWLENAPPEDALRRAVAAGAASTLSVGAGRFDPDDLRRLLPDVHVKELTAVASA